MCSEASNKFPCAQKLAVTVIQNQLPCSLRSNIFLQLIKPVSCHRLAAIFSSGQLKQSCHITVRQHFPPTSRTNNTAPTLLGHNITTSHHISSSTGTTYPNSNIFLWEIKPHPDSFATLSYVKANQSHHLIHCAAAFSPMHTS